MRGTLHITSARDYLALATVWQARRREDLRRLGHDVDAAEAAARKALDEEPRTYTWLNQQFGEAFSRRFGPLVPLTHLPPAGTWRHHGRTLLMEGERWLGASLGRREAGAALLVERYLGAFGPASKADLLRLAGLRGKDVQAGLEALEPRLRRFRDGDGRPLLDLARSPLPAATTPTPARFLGRWDSALLGYDRRARILPDEYAGAQVTLTGDQVFLADGFVAGLWTVERAASAATLVLRPFAPLPRTTRSLLDDEGRQLLRWHEPEADLHRLRWS
jgi:DNA glycosylase AlkZ-like